MKEIGLRYDRDVRCCVFLLCCLSLAFQTHSGSFGQIPGLVVGYSLKSKKMSGIVRLLYYFYIFVRSSLLGFESRHQGTALSGDASARPQNTHAVNRFKNPPKIYAYVTLYRGDPHTTPPFPHSTLSQIPICMLRIDSISY